MERTIIVHPLYCMIAYCRLCGNSVYIDISTAVKQRSAVKHTLNGSIASASETFTNVSNEGSGKCASP